MVGKIAVMTAPKLLLEDDFRQGLDMDGAWAIVKIPGRLVADDGTVSTSSGGLHVKAAGEESANRRSGIHQGVLTGG